MATKTNTTPDKPRISEERLLTHLVLAIGTVSGFLLAYVFDPSAVLAEPLSIGLGYVALVYLVAGLLVGPLYLARQRRNPVNIYLRRDIGIWAGITALVHVFFSFQIFANGQILLYFFQQVRDHYLPQLNLFGLSNDVGLLAAIIVFVLLVLSNDQALRWLKGKLWKRIQQWSYPLIVLTIVHTLGYQLYNERDSGYIWALVALTLIVGVAQGTGFLVHKHRARRRTASQARRVHPSSVPIPARRLESAQVGGALPPETVSRRRFLRAGGLVLLGAIASVVALKVAEETLGQDDDRPTAYRPPESEAPTAEVPSTAVPTGEVAANNGGAEPTAVPSDTPDNPPAAQAPSDNPPATEAPASTPTDPGTGTNGGTVITSLAACPVNSALTFTAPDTGETGILVHEADGSVKAFSNICTHRPYPVQYDPNNKLLVCPLHYACFNAASGDVTQGPARRALAPIKVHVDGSNVVYG